MKKSLLALAVLSAFAGAASAQSTVTLYGRVDLSANKPIGTKAKGISNGSGSRLGVRGVEDLGGGLKALFNIEHRFNADDGQQTDAAGNTSTNNNGAALGRFWTGRSIVGLEGGFGQIVVGREYTTTFLQGQLIADPWGFDTVVSNTPGPAAGVTGNATILTGLIARVRNSNSVTYKIAAAGFTFGAQIAEGEGNPHTSVGQLLTGVPAASRDSSPDKRPTNFTLSYGGGPIYVAAGYENPADNDDNWTHFQGSFNLGFAKLGAFVGNGKNELAQKHSSYLVTATAPIGAGEFRASYGQLKNKTLNAVATKTLGLGYHYSLSKRTTVYADFVREGQGTKAPQVAATTQKTGYDFGLKHNF
jgi:predicted porin